MAAMIHLAAPSPAFSSPTSTPTTTAVFHSNLTPASLSSRVTDTTSTGRLSNTRPILTRSTSSARSRNVVPAPLPAAASPFAAAGQPLPRVTDALPVLDTDSPPGALDPGTAPDARQRLLHSRFPSLNRIRSRKSAHDSLSLHHRSRTSSQSANDVHSPSTTSAPRQRPVSPLRSSIHNNTPNSTEDTENLLSSAQPSPTSFYSAGSYDDPPPYSAYAAAAPETRAVSTLQSKLAEEKSSVQPKGAFPGNSPASRSDDWPTRNSSNTPRNVNMHQTSSRLLRMTDDDRPFTRDFKDLFSTLMVSLPLTPHRVRFSKVEHTFTTDEAITNLGSLKFSQSNRMPDPKDPSRIVTTTTTTTFSMAKEMARSVCTRFLEARFIESCEGKNDFNSKSGVWQLTPKGLRVLTRFCGRNGIHQRHVNEVLDSPRNAMQLVILERDPETDKISHDRAIVEVIFRRFAGDGPNVKASSGSSDTDSLAEYGTGMVGVRVVKSRNLNVKDCPYVFTGKSCLDWLIDCCMVVDRRECLEISNLFIAHDLISAVPEEKNLEERRFQPLKSAHYHITTRGMRLAGWMRSPTVSVSTEPTSKFVTNAGRDSTMNKMGIIIRDPALRLLFREFLQDIHCEENLTFYLDVKAFLADYNNAKRSDPPRLDVIRENLASAYSLYNAFLAPGSPCELNIDHNLRNALAGRMTRAVGEDTEMVASLDEVAVLFDQAMNSVFKLMASDSVPKFARDPKYANVIRERNLEHLLTGLNLH